MDEIDEFESDDVLIDAVDIVDAENDFRSPFALSIGELIADES